HGIGASPEAAIADAREQSGDPEAEYITMEASIRLIESVKVRGGGSNLRWIALDSVRLPIRQLRANYDRCLAVPGVDRDEEGIEALKVEAGAAGDSKLVATCNDALGLDHEAREIVRGILDDAHNMAQQG